jgi:hypothetical protein
MVDYIAGFYRISEAFGEATMLETLKCLHNMKAGFFPASVWLSKHEKVVLKNPLEYDRNFLPCEYFISQNAARIPFESQNGAEVVFTESDEPCLSPASLTIGFTDKNINANKWSALWFADLFGLIVRSFTPDYSYLFDEEHKCRDYYSDIMFDIDLGQVPIGIFWWNHYSTKWVNNIGRKRIEDIENELSYLEWLGDGGLIFSIQSEPYDEANDMHRIRQRSIEEAAGLAEIHASFPNRGL